MKNLLALLIITFSLLGCATLSTTPTTPTPPKEMTEIYGKWNSTSWNWYNKFVKISPTKFEFYDTMGLQSTMYRLDATFHVEYLTAATDDDGKIHHVFKVIKSEIKDTYEWKSDETTYIGINKYQDRDGSHAMSIRIFEKQKFNKIKEYSSRSHYEKRDD